MFRNIVIYDTSYHNGSYLMYIYIYISTYIYAYINIYKWTSIKSKCKLSVCISNNLRWLNEKVKRVLRYEWHTTGFTSLRFSSLYKYTYVYIYINIYIYTYINIYIYICICYTNYIICIIYINYNYMHIYTHLYIYIYHALYMCIHDICINKFYNNWHDFDFLIPQSI